MARAVEEVGAMKVVDGAEVEFLTRQGWYLQEILQETHVESFSEQVPFVTHGSTYVQNASATKGFLVTKNKFVMVQGKSGTIQELERQLAEAQRGQYNAQAECRKAEETAKGALEALKREQEISTGRFEQVNASYAVRRELEETKRKMENDIAKIRAAIGDIRMKEILAS
jgi:hypothetical protein